MTRPNTIALITRGRHEEAVANGAISPGHLVEPDSAGAVGVHATVGGAHRRWVAKEDTFQGKTITGSNQYGTVLYASGDQVMIQECAPNDRMLMRLKAGQSATKGNELISAGDGSLIVALVKAGLLYESVAASASIASTTAETAFDKSFTLPANSLRVGDVLRIRIQTIAPTTNSTDTLTVKLYIGSLMIVTTGAVDVANGDIGFIDAIVTVRTIGASGTVEGAGEVGLGVPGTVTGKPFLLASSALDTTVANVVVAKATWSVSSASDIVRLDTMTVNLERSGGDALVGRAFETVDNSVGVTEAFIRVDIA